MPGAMPMSYEAGKVEVVTSVQRRRRWTLAEKVQLVEEANQPGAAFPTLPANMVFLPANSSDGGG